MDVQWSSRPAKLCRLGRKPGSSRMSKVAARTAVSKHKFGHFARPGGAWDEWIRRFLKAKNAVLFLQLDMATVLWLKTGTSIKQSSGLASLENLLSASSRTLGANTSDTSAPFLPFDLSTHHGALYF